MVVNEEEIVEMERQRIRKGLLTEEEQCAAMQQTVALLASQASLECTGLATRAISTGSIEVLKTAQEILESLRTIASLGLRRSD